MALSNIMGLMQMQNADYATAMKLQEAGCKPDQSGQHHNLSEAFAAGCPADKAEFSQQALAQLNAQLEQLQHGGSQAQLTPEHPHGQHHHAQGHDHGVH
jgi:hypothetical protein